MHTVMLYHYAVGFWIIRKLPYFSRTAFPSFWHTSTAFTNTFGCKLASIYFTVLNYMWTTMVMTFPRAYTQECIYIYHQYHKVTGWFQWLIYCSSIYHWCKLYWSMRFNIFLTGIIFSLLALVFVFHHHMVDDARVIIAMINISAKTCTMCTLSLCFICTDFFKIRIKDIMTYIYFIF